MNSLHDKIKSMISESMDDADRANMFATLRGIDKQFGVGNKNLGSMIRGASSALSAHGSDSHKKYINHDGSLTGEAKTLNAKFKSENPHEPEWKNHPIVGGALYAHQNIQYIKSVTDKVKK